MDDEEVVDITAVVHISDVELANNAENEQEILPTQTSPEDTSNWDDRPFTTPGDRIVIETFESNENSDLVAE